MLIRAEIATVWIALVFIERHSLLLNWCLDCHDSLVPYVILCAFLCKLILLLKWLCYGSIYMEIWGEQFSDRVFPFSRGVKNGRGPKIWIFPESSLHRHVIYQNLRFYVHEYVFGAREFISDIRFEIWPILREMGVKKGVFRVKNGQKHFCQWITEMFMQWH